MLKDDDEGKKKDYNKVSLNDVVKHGQTVGWLVGRPGTYVEQMKERERTTEEKKNDYSVRQSST